MNLSKKFYNMLFGEEYLHNHRINTLPFRSYYVPFSKDDKPQYIHSIIDKFSSSRIINLNGIWNIKEHDCLNSVKSIDETLQGKIVVPSVVQLNGYDHIQYVNDRYPFPFNPPFVPKNNPTYHYRKTISIDKLDSFKYHLVFEGVDSAFYVFVNSHKVGYSLISHAMSEFDITDHINEGENVIDVVVLKWNSSSYLEDQDKFRFTGIFRNVYILKRPLNFIKDFKISSYRKNEKYFVEVQNLSNDKVNFELLNQAFTLQTNEIKTIEVVNPRLWSNQDPYLYDATIFNDEEVIYQKFGVVVSEIIGGVFRINNVHEKLKGVNRHEISPVKGPAIDIEDTYNDLVLIKECNVNAIRTSHYQDIPEFYELCNVLGIYVLDEADIESHGAVYHNDEYDLIAWERFANNGLYDDAVLDREKSLYERDKNFTSVIIFSLGNESSFGKMFIEGINYIKERDKRPIHYEGMWNVPHTDELYYHNGIDMVSRMYPEYEWLKHGYLDDLNETRPLLLCEYSHAMGNSCGDISDYWKTIMSSDRFMGAFIWEWCDHSLLIDGKLIYGGDSGEKLHDSNFCVDGIVTAFRELKSAAYEMKAIYSNPYVDETKKEMLVPFEPLEYNNPIKVVFDKEKVQFNQVLLNGINILTKPLKIGFTRANIDNDINNKDEIALLRNSKTIIEDYLEEDNFIKFEAAVVADDGTKLFKYNATFQMYNDAIDIELFYFMLSEIDLPRFGISFAIANCGGVINYYGYGPLESYIDKYAYDSIDDFTINVKDNYSHLYLKPQESGSHYYTSYFSVDNLRVIAQKPFSFNCIEFDEEQLIKAKHDYELISDNNIYVNIDIAIAGVGTNSCGPKLKKKYRLNVQDSNKFRLFFK